MLPFLVNETLVGEERERLVRHVEGSASAQHELAFLRSVRSALREGPAVEGPTESERQQILDCIRAQSRGERPAAPRGIVWALAAALLLALFEGGWILKMGWSDVDRAVAGPGPADTSYRPAGSSTSAQIAVQFNDAVTAKEIRELLLGQGLLVVDGPSALGVYELVLASGGENEEKIAEVVEVLRRHAIVSYAGAL